jgi:hypothetical protein
MNKGIPQSTYDTTLVTMHAVMKIVIEPIHSAELVTPSVKSTSAVRACVGACVRACVCVCACVRACACVRVCMRCG